jgi:hypothetical protein
MNLAKNSVILQDHFLKRKNRAIAKHLVRIAHTINLESGIFSFDLWITLSKEIEKLPFHINRVSRI